MSARKPILLGGSLRLPCMIYGTAFKDSSTDKCVSAALEAGFWAFDSAPHPTAYNEALVGKGLRDVLGSAAQKERGSGVFIQTKFTTDVAYKDRPKPYSSQEPPAEQVRKSLYQSKNDVESGSMTVTAFMLHAPLPTIEATMEYWHAMETQVPEQIQYLGISNVSFETLKEVYDRSTIKPTFVQNDFGPSFGYDLDIIDWCTQKGIVYQAYGVLKSNLSLLESKLVGWLAEVYDITEPQALYLLLLSYGDGYVCILNGTSQKEVMISDLEVVERIGKLESNLVDAFVEELKSNMFRIAK